MARLTATSAPHFPPSQKPHPTVHRHARGRESWYRPVVNVGALLVTRRVNLLKDETSDCGEVTRSGGILAQHSRPATDERVNDRHCGSRCPFLRGKNRTE